MLGCQLWLLCLYFIIMICLDFNSLFVTLYTIHRPPTSPVPAPISGDASLARNLRAKQSDQSDHFSPQSNFLFWLLNYVHEKGSLAPIRVVFFGWDAVASTMFRARALFGALGATALAVYVALVVSDVIRVSGSGDGSFSPHGLDACVRYLGMDASEDIAIDHDNNIAFVSSNSLRSEFIPAVGMAPSFDHVGIYALNLASLPSPRAALTPLPLVDYPFASFRPVGISVYVDKRLNIRRLFVANRRRRFRKTAIMEALWPIYMPCVSVFDIVEAAGGLQLRHVASYEDPLIVSPNDVAAVGPDRFVSIVPPAPIAHSSCQLLRDERWHV